MTPEDANATPEDGNIDLSANRAEKHLWRPGKQPRNTTRFVLWIVLALFLLAATCCIAFLVLR
jgi:hypothetical protein